MGGDRATASAFARDPVACHHEARAPPRRPVVTAPWRDALDRLADDPGAALEALEAAAPDDAEALAARPGMGWRWPARCGVGGRLR